MGSLADLWARVMVAAGPDRQLDRDLAVALYQPEDWRPECRPAPTAHGCVVITYVAHDGRRTYGTSPAQPYTRSIEAVIDLCGKALPSLRIDLFMFATSCTAAVWPNEDDEFRATGKTPASALLKALLKALIAKEPA